MKLGRSIATYGLDFNFNVPNDIRLPAERFL
jgi:hypothetical protein